VSSTAEVPTLSGRPWWSLKSQLGFNFRPRTVERPGSRGGHFWVDAVGHVRYDAPPVGVTVHPPGTPLPAPPVVPPTAVRPQGALLASSGDDATRWPPAAKTYADGAQHWEVLEPEFLGRAVTAARQRLVANIRYYEEHELPRLNLSRIAGQRKRVEFENHLRFWRADVERIDRGDTARVVDRARLEYGKIVKLALSKGKPVPLPVIAQRLEFRTARDARQRYEKGWHTSFANKSLAVHSGVVESHGVKIKRQDGKAILPSQQQEIVTGIREVEEALGPLTDVLRQTDLTVAHTSGKHPFMRQAGGLYQTGEVTISIGIDDVLGRPIRALAHELGHWLDFQAGRAAGVLSKRATGSWGKAKIVSSSAVSDHDWTSQTAGVIGDARRAINDTRMVMTTLKLRLNATENVEERARIERTKVALGPYWREPCEVWARLVEQYVATKRFAPIRGELDALQTQIMAASSPDERAPLVRRHRELVQERTGVAADSPLVYEQAPGWWSRADFARFMPRIEEEIGRRLGMLRAAATPARGATP
jgi:hypothetical protein